MAEPEKNSLETILVVEDDQMVLRIVSEILKRAGFCVLAAGNGAQAIQVKSTTPGNDRPFAFRCEDAGHVWTGCRTNF